MDLGVSSIALSISAGLASVLSPCVLPVVPVIVAGGEQKDRLRPLLVVLGLAITFMAMGVVSSLFGASLIGMTRRIEQAGGAIIFAMGLIVFFDLGLFKRMYRLSNIQVKSDGRFGGLVLGMALGIIWIPCIGPMLSSILAMVSAGGQVLKGVSLLGFYSLGFAIPMLALAYSSHILQQRIKALGATKILRYFMGAVLMLFGLYVIFVGNFAF